MNKADIIIFTAISEEFKAVTKYLNNSQSIFLKGAGTFYQIGEYNGFKVAVTQTEAGNVKAASEVERGINNFNPQFIFFVGVAGGLKDVEIGDVVVGTKVYAFEIGKAAEVYKPRFEFGISNYALTQKAKALQIQETWQNKIIPTKFSSNFGTPKVYIKPIAVGEKVVANKNSAVYKLIKQNCSDALAVEMEGYGFLEAARPYTNISALLLRGISDLVDGKGAADDSGSQLVASSNVAAFAFAVIDMLDNIDNTSTTSSQSKTVTSSPNINDLYSLVCKLYPKGLQDNRIWERSGGDIGYFSHNDNPKSQWWDALQKLKNGGGGTNISHDTLIKTIKIDYPKVL